MKFWGRSQKAKRVAVSEKSTYSHPQLGSIIINRSSRASRISIAISREGAIKLTLPFATNIQKGLDFLNQKTEWIEAAQTRVATRNSKVIKVIEPPFSTKFHSLRLEATACTKTSISISEKEIIVSYPLGLSHLDHTIQQAIFQAIETTCRLEAKDYLPQRVEQLAAYSRSATPQYKWNFGKVSVRKARSRWGSCAANNNISLNISLILLPDHLIDYIILHELTHTVHKNHGAKFHALLNKLLSGQEAILVRELKNFTPLMPPSSHHL